MCLLFWGGRVGFKAKSRLPLCTPLVKVIWRLAAIYWLVKLRDIAAVVEGFTWLAYFTPRDSPFNSLSLSSRAHGEDPKLSGFRHQGEPWGVHQVTQPVPDWRLTSSTSVRLSVSEASLEVPWQWTHPQEVLWRWIHHQEVLRQWTHPQEVSMTQTLWCLKFFGEKVANCSSFHSIDIPEGSIEKPRIIRFSGSWDPCGVPPNPTVCFWPTLDQPQNPVLLSEDKLID